ncbi:MAG TPA: hypothetical protein VFP05_16305 [Thermomicrobiales bacterium]|nr:hypothetical protein [Thermomicrobiales bacterium]
MRKLSGTLAALAIAGALALAGQGPVTAQNATPVFPDLSECVVEPRTVDNIVDLTLNGDYEPDADIAAGKLPTGDPAPASAVDDINAMLRQFIACANKNDIPRMLALMTDNGAQFFLDFESTITEEQLRAMAAAPVSPVAADEREAFVPMSDLVVFDDGRIGGRSTESSDDGDSVYLIFANVDGNWLIDQITEIVGPATPEATPAA